MESLVKQVSRRLKGTEKFWSPAGGEALLQLCADTLSETAPLAAYWQFRTQRQTGFHPRKPRAGA
jgi:hypothetical protein